MGCAIGALPDDVADMSGLLIFHKANCSASWLRGFYALKKATGCHTFISLMG